MRVPIVSAPMAFAGGGALAAAVSHAGGLGLIGGGYGDPTWLEQQFAAAGGERIGVGFITWSLRKSPSMLTDVLKHSPAAVMLSFGDPRPFVDEIRAAGALLICQCQDMAHVMDAVDVRADIVVAQGAEAGGHGALRGTLSFVPEAADYLAEHAPRSTLAGRRRHRRWPRPGRRADAGRRRRAGRHALLGSARGAGQGRTPSRDPGDRRRRHAAHPRGRHRTAASLAARLYGAHPPQCVHAAVAWPRGSARSRGRGRRAALSAGLRSGRPRADRGLVRRGRGRDPVDRAGSA